MWIQIRETQEWIPFDAEHSSKVFLDGEKGWAVKQKDGTVYHVSKEQYEKKLLRELDYDSWWKINQIKEAARGLSEDETIQVKKLLKAMNKKNKKEEEED